MKEHWARLWWDIRHLLSNDANPYVNKPQPGGFEKGVKRTGFEDLAHAIKNIPKEYLRERRRAKRAKEKANAEAPPTP